MSARSSLCENYFGIIMPPTHRFKSLFGCGATPDGAWTVRGKIRNDVRLKDDDHCYCTEIICTVVCCVCRCVLSHGGSVSLPVGYSGLSVFGSLAAEETTEVVQSKELVK